MAILGTTTGVLFTFAGDLPQISALDDYAPNTISRVYARNGETIGEFATQRRVVIDYEDISPYLRDAIIAAEDAGFYSHVGLSISRLAITIMRDVVRGELAGASTLTQQLARNLFLTQEKTLTRKVKELLLSFQIEKRYTKTEILALYCNQILFGQPVRAADFGASAAAAVPCSHPYRVLMISAMKLWSNRCRHARTLRFTDMKQLCPFSPMWSSLFQQR